MHIVPLDNRSLVNNELGIVSRINKEESIITQCILQVPFNI